MKHFFHLFLLISLISVLTSGLLASEKVLPDYEFRVFFLDSSENEPDLKTPFSYENGNYGVGEENRFAGLSKDEIAAVIKKAITPLSIHFATSAVEEKDFMDHFIGIGSIIYKDIIKEIKKNCNFLNRLNDIEGQIW